MSIESFSTAFSVHQTPDHVFAAINNVRGWWGGEIVGSAENVDDEFTYRYEDVHYSKQRVTELVPGKKVSWRVLDASLSFAGDPREWADTEITFELTANRDGTEVRFTHDGLVPRFDCFDACSSAWAFYINESLRTLITTGNGPVTPPWA